MRNHLVGAKYEYHPTLTSATSQKTLPQPRTVFRQNTDEEESKVGQGAINDFQASPSRVPAMQKKPSLITSVFSGIFESQQNAGNVLPSTLKSSADFGVPHV